MGFENTNVIMLEAQERGQNSEQVDCVQVRLFTPRWPWMILGMKFSENTEKVRHVVCFLAYINPIAGPLLPCAISQSIY